MGPMPPKQAASAASHLVIRGAREHNLKDVNLELPRDALIVFTGLSGSGKSSLAFDTIYAEGQRRYVESLSSYARQFLGQLEKPVVDLAETAGTRLDKYYKHDIEVIVDRLVLKPDIGRRLSDSIETALGLTEGVVGIELVDNLGVKTETILFSERAACLNCGLSF